MQQLGRGLRLSEDKECLTVLDFIGQANRKYNFEDKFAALLSNATRSVSREIKDGFVSVPKGCYIQLEKKAAKYILENIRASYGDTAGLAARAASFAEDSGLELTLKNFLDYYHLDPRAIYKFSSFSRICARADAIEDFSEPLEDILTKALAKLAVSDSRRWISFLLDVLPRLDNLDFAALPDAEKRMMQIYHGGFLSPQKRKLVTLIVRAASKDVKARFWADIDAGGFRMFDNLQKLISSVLPMRMSGELVEKFHEHGLMRSNEYLSELAADLKSGRYLLFKDAIEKILSYGVTIEQETFLN